MSAADGGAGKVFVGGLSWETTNENLKNYFSRYGEIIDSVIMKDKSTGHPRGFGFVTYADSSVVDRVMHDKHVLDGRAVETKRAVSREAMQTRGPKTKKIFVGGLASATTEADFRGYFERYGTVVEAQIMYERDTGRPRGFGFVTFSTEDAVEQIVSEPRHAICDKEVEVKKAEPKASMAPSRDRGEPRYPVRGAPYSGGGQYGAAHEGGGGGGRGGYGGAYGGGAAYGANYGDFARGYGAGAGYGLGPYGMAGLGGYDLGMGMGGVGLGLGAAGLGGGLAGMAGLNALGGMGGMGLGAMGGMGAMGLGGMGMAGMGGMGMGLGGPGGAGALGAGGLGSSSYGAESDKSYAMRGGKSERAYHPYRS